MDPLRAAHTYTMDHRTRCEHLYRGLLAALAVPPKDVQKSLVYMSVLGDTRACDDVWDLSGPRSALNAHQRQCAQKPGGLGWDADKNDLCARQALLAHRWNIRLELFRGLPWRARADYLMDQHPFVLLEIGRAHV